MPSYTQVELGFVSPDENLLSLSILKSKPISVKRIGRLDYTSLCTLVNLHTLNGKEPLNQIEFTDNINDQQLVSNSGETSDDSLVSVGLIANPLSINITASDTRTYVSLSTGLNGSLRIESLKGFNDSDAETITRDMGPIAVDGIRVKHCVIEFPGEYKRPDGSFTGRIDPKQLVWLNKLIEQP